jgi:hypothetical protein
MQPLAAPDRHYGQGGGRGAAVATRKYRDVRDAGRVPPPRGPQLARRRLLLVAAGGVAIGVATVTSRGGGGHLAARSLDEVPHNGPTRKPPTATRSAHPARPRAARPASVPPARTADTGAGRPMYYVDDGPHVIALTIDDGPSPVYTPQVLSILEKYGITAERKSDG